MKKIIFVDPGTKAPLSYTEKDGIIEYSSSQSRDKYLCVNGINDFIFPKHLSPTDNEVSSHYDNRAEAYEANLHLTFKTHYLDEVTCRNGFIDLLGIEENHRVMEIACGTGRDSVLIADRLAGKGELHLADISKEMLMICQKKIVAKPIDSYLCLANAANLPYPDNYFDSTYSFGGLGEFSEIAKSLAEMVRVTKTGGKIVVGDESMPPWLRGTYFSNVLSTTNPQFLAPLPLNEMPAEARNVHLRWVIGGTFYLIDFEVGEGEPTANFDFEIPGIRGGTYRTRYEGQLEGVRRETKELANRAIKASKTSMHDWLDRVVREAAEKDLGHTED